jgi:predicted transcriptional regulator
MNHTGSPANLYECATCGNVGIGDGEIRCCEEPMTPIESPAVVDKPTLGELLSSVFDMSDTELEICLCVMEGGDLTVTELADEIGYDRSVVARHLNHLAELGVIEKQRRLLEQGGHTYVYTPVPEEAVRRQLTVAFYTWVDGALDRLDSLQREKVESIADTGDTPAWEIFRET